MSNTELSQEQMVTILYTIYQELKIILKQMEPLAIPDDDKRRKEVLDGVRYLLQKGCKVKLRDKSLYTLFEGIK